MRAETNELQGGYTQVIIRQTAPGEDAVPDSTLVLRNYSDGYVEITDGKDEMLISPNQAKEVARWIAKLPGLVPKEKGKG